MCHIGDVSVLQGSDISSKTSKDGQRVRSSIFCRVGAQNGLPDVKGERGGYEKIGQVEDA